jgi:hypothetical protein
MTGIDLRSLFVAFDEFVEDSYMKIEWWMGSEFFEKDINNRTEIGSLAQDLRNQEAAAHLPLDLVLFVYTNYVLEVTFSATSIPAPPTRLAVALSSINDRFLKLFSRFHRNKSVQMNPDFAQTAFSAPIGKGFEMLGPVWISS